MAKPIVPFLAALIDKDRASRGRPIQGRTEWPSAIDEATGSDFPAEVGSARAAGEPLGRRDRPAPGQGAPETLPWHPVREALQPDAPGEAAARAEPVSTPSRLSAPIREPGRSGIPAAPMPSPAAGVIYPTPGANGTEEVANAAIVETRPDPLPRRTVQAESPVHRSLPNQVPQAVQPDQAMSATPKAAQAAVSSPLVAHSPAATPATHIPAVEAPLRAPPRSDPVERPARKQADGNPATAHRAGEAQAMATNAVHIGRVQVTLIDDRPRVPLREATPKPEIRRDSFHYLRRY